MLTSQSIQGVIFGALSRFEPVRRFLCISGQLVLQDWWEDMRLMAPGGTCPAQLHPSASSASPGVVNSSSNVLGALHRQGEVSDVW